jgi:hypothetical protein
VPTYVPLASEITDVIPRGVLTGILDFDWDHRDASALRKLVDGPLTETAKTLREMRRISAVVDTLVATHADAAAFDSALPGNVAGGPLVERLASAAHRATDVPSRSYWMILITLLGELEEGIQCGVMPHVWQLERVILTSQFFNDQGRHKLTVARCERHLKLSRADYGVDRSEPLRAAFSALGSVPVESKCAFFAAFAQAVYFLNQFEDAVAVSDCILGSDLAMAAPHLSSTCRVVTDHVDMIVPPFENYESAALDGFSMHQRFANLMDLTDTFDRAIGALIRDAEGRAKGPLRKRREMVRAAVLGFLPDGTIRWAWLDSLALWATTDAMADILRRCLRHIDDEDFETLIVRHLVTTISGWRETISGAWWGMPYPYARTALVGVLTGAANERFGHSRAVAMATELLLGSTGDGSQCADALRRESGARARRLANFAMNCITQIMIGDAERFDVIDVLQSYLEIGPYENWNAASDGLAAEIRSRYQPDRPGEPWDRPAFELHARLGSLLFASNRFVEGWFLVRAALGWDESNPASVAQNCTGFIRESPRCLPALLGVAVQLSIACDEVEPLRGLLEAILDVDGAAWQSSRLLVEATRRRIQDRHLEEAVAYPLVNCVAFCAAVGGEDWEVAMHVLTAFLEIEGLDATEIHERLSRIAPHVGLPVLSDLLLLLSMARRHSDVLDVFAGLCGVQATDPLEWGSLTAAWKRNEGAREWYWISLGPGVLRAALAALKARGRLEEARQMAQCAAAEWLNTGEERVNTRARCDLALECIRTLIGTDPETALELASNVGWSLGWDHAGWGQMSLDRLRLTSQTVEARHVLSEVANTLTLVEGFGTRAQQYLVRHEAFLGVQEVVERIRRGSPAISPSDGPTLAEAWAMSKEDRRRARRAKLSERSTALSQSVSLPNRTRPVSVRRPDRQKREEWFDNARLKDMGGALSSGEIVLKVGFAMDGRLVWTLFGADGTRMTVTASGSGSAGARETIAAAVDRFHRRNDAAWDAQDCGTAERLGEALDGMRWLLAWEGRQIISPRDFQRDAHNRMRGLCSLFPRTVDQSLREFGDPGRWHESVTQGYPERETWWRWWTETLSLLSNGPGTSAELSRVLDQATNDLLAAVRKAWPLDELFEAIPPKCQLLIQPSDVLHAVPIPFLNLPDSEGKPRFLFERADCASVIVSPLIDWWQRETLDSMPICNSESALHRIASVSWLGPREREHASELYATYLLQASQRRLAMRAGLEYGWWSAGGSEQAPGSHAVLARGVHDAGDAGLALLTICGHGAANAAGVFLSDGLWQGTEFLERPAADDQPWNRGGGVDLATAQFVIMLSCAMGRIKQARLADAEGFCVNLIVNNARSVLAGRWTLDAVDSIRFAHDVARHYLRWHRRAAEHGEPLWKLRARGRSVASARRRWAKDYRQGQAKVGINTVAALELYGLR